MMYELRDAVQNIECSSPESLGLLSFVCEGVYAYVFVCKYTSGGLSDPDSSHPSEIQRERECSFL